MVKKQATKVASSDGYKVKKKRKIGKEFIINLTKKENLCKVLQ
jgi:hypothetical protein